MADYDLKYTGQQIDALLDAANELKTNGYIYKGVATPSTNPGTPTERVAYLASEPGTYTNFGGIVIASGLYSLTYVSGTWTGTQMSAGSDIEVVQTTGDSTTDVMSQKAVTDEVAVTTNTLGIDLSKLTQVTAFPSPNDDWIASGTYKGVFVPIPSNKKYKIKANAEYQGYYCFLKTNSYSRGAAIDYATGCTRVVVPANAEVIDTAPSDARYLYINTYITHNTTPQLVELIDEKSIKEVVSEAEVSEVYKHVNTWEIISEFTVGKYIATSQGVGNYCPMTTTNLSSMDCIKIDAVAGEKYRIVGVGGNNPRLWATIDKNTSTILAAFDGYIGSQYIPFDEIIEIEQDCWLIINVYNNTASPAYYNYLETPYSLQKVAWSITGNEEIIIPVWELGTWILDTHADSTKRIRNKGFDALEAGTYIFSIKNGYQFYIYVDEQEYTFRTWAKITLTKKSYIQIILRLSSDEPLSDYVPSEFVAESGFKIISDIGTIKRINNDIANINNYIKAGDFDDTLPIGDDTTIISTRRSYMLKYGTEEEVDYLYFSNDLGSTWTRIQNIYGNIVHVHWFNDGTCLFCTEQHCYYTKDFVTINESIVYDYNGAVSTPSGQRFYNPPKGIDSYMVDGKEFHLWYDYFVGSNVNPRLWYSNDNGVTVRAAFAFGISSINGSIIKARHGHGFKYNPYDDYFYAWTGDSAEECHIIRGKCANNTWTWELVASGIEYKLGTIIFKGANMFCVTDYTDSSLINKKGLIRCPIDDINSNNFEYLYKAVNMGNVSLSDIWVDKSGWKVMVPDYLGGNETLIANNGFNFKWVTNFRNIRINGFTGPNYNGDIYCKYATDSSVILHIMRPTINLTEAMHIFGAYDFGKEIEFDSIVW